MPLLKNSFWGYTLIMKFYIIQFLYWIIALIEKIQYRGVQFDENNIYKKVIDLVFVKDLKVLSDSGFVPVSEINITQPYTFYRIDFEDGNFLEGADNHILFTPYGSCKSVQDLRAGDLVKSIDGFSKIKSIKKLNRKVSMADLTVDSVDSSYYTNGILSHNTVSAAIAILHFILFNNNKNVMIIANKGDTTVEIVDKIKSIYKLLPYFLQKGVKNWNQKSLIFDNGCRIKTSARTKTPAIGFTIDFLYLDEFAHIPSNIIEPYYTAAFPTVSSIKNSKIIITSTPNGMNLFHKLLTDAERPDGDPKKNSYKAMRVYWYQVPDRHVTYIRLNKGKLYEYGLTNDDIYDLIKEIFPDERKDLKYDPNINKDVIFVYDGSKDSSTDKIRSLRIVRDPDPEKPDDKGLDISINEIAEITNWKEEEIKGIGSEEAFNQEYNLRFISGSKSLFNEKVMDRILQGKKNFIHRELEEFDKRLKFDYKDLKWIDDDSIFHPANKKEVKGVISVDVSEGLGQDSSVINIFKIDKKDDETIELQKKLYKHFADFSCLKQIGIFRSNFVSVQQLAEVLYVLAFEYFKEDNFKIVLELNAYGNELLAYMPKLFEGKNNYGSNVFFKFKHRADATDEKIGLKVNGNKNLIVKDYQDQIQRGDIILYEENTIRELTTFIRDTTTAGNVKYHAETGNDDCIMTVVNMTTVFPKNSFRDLVEVELGKNKDFMTYINKCLDTADYKEGTDYKSFFKIKNRILRNKFDKGDN